MKLQVVQLKDGQRTASEIECPPHTGLASLEYALERRFGKMVLHGGPNGEIRHWSFRSAGGQVTTWVHWPAPVAPGRLVMGGER